MSSPSVAPAYIMIEGTNMPVHDIIALYDAGDVVEIILKPVATYGAFDRPCANVRVVSMTVSQVVSLIGFVPPIIHGHLARSVRR